MADPNPRSPLSPSHLLSPPLTPNACHPSLWTHPAPPGARDTTNLPLHPAQLSLSLPQSPIFAPEASKRVGS